MKKLLAALTIVLMTGACAWNADLDGDGKTLGDFTIADLKSAEELATAQGDDVAALCYIELSKYVASKQGAATPNEAAGLFTKFQKVRGFRRSRSEGLPEDINTRCAPLITSGSKTILLLRRLIL